MIEKIAYLIAGVISFHSLEYSIRHHEIFLGMLDIIGIVIFGILFITTNKNKNG